jgi:Ser/Thr protein kinase RdoA (MazF antagonist)
MIPILLIFFPLFCHAAPWTDHITLYPKEAIYQAETLEQAVHNYANAHQLRERSLHQGLSGNLVYTLLQEETPKCIVKSYATTDELMKDLWSQIAANRLQLKLFQVPKVLEVTKVKVLDREYYLFIQEYVPGQILWPLLDPLSRSAKDEQAFNHAAHVMELLGQSLREFHDKSTWKRDQLSPPLVDGLHWATHKGIEVLKKYPELGVEPADLQKALEYLHKKIEKKSFPWSYLHMDPHLGNFLYDPTTDKLAMIDMGEGSQLIDWQFRGMGTPIYDFIRVQGHIRSQAFRIEEEVIEGLVDAFNRGYGNPVWGEEEYFYFFIIDTLESLIWYDTPNVHVKKEIKEIVKMSIENRMKRINQWFLKIPIFKDAEQ